uniref:Uncharacterized protein n=1 Tax=Setaria digitata TaxID=48799 RepID=A0A915PNZ1_9BILA
MSSINRPFCSRLFANLQTWLLRRLKGPVFHVFDRPQAEASTMCWFFTEFVAPAYASGRLTWHRVCLCVWVYVEHVVCGCLAISEAGLLPDTNTHTEDRDREAVCDSVASTGCVKWLTLSSSSIPSVVAHLDVGHCRSGKA